ncbi:RNA ligase family protein [Kribbella sp. NPDC051587]|uniref:RNA ligase family protein n=1 Tax=Kribbella sp. NPDC051587 TaxID=3364119 RepID=UPI0037B607F7
MLDLRDCDLDNLNSVTKYPSIPTYHSLDPRNGGLLDERVPFAGPVIGTEKVDGTNARIITLPDGSYLLGSREELLYAKGDLIGNPALGIVAELRSVADALPVPAADRIEVRFLEVYGGKVTGASKNYTGEKRVGHRLFDAIHLTDYEALLAQPRAALSDWRESGHQPFFTEEELQKLATTDGLTLTPRLFTLDAADLPNTLTETQAFLTTHLPHTLSGLDATATGTPEGIVLRTPTRTTIAKARFADYTRTLRRKR